MGNLSPFPSTHAPTESSPATCARFENLTNCSLRTWHQNTSAPHKPAQTLTWNLGGTRGPKKRSAQKRPPSVPNRFEIGSESVRNRFEIGSESVRNRSRAPFRPFRFEIGSKSVRNRCQICSKSVRNRFPQINRVSIWQPIFYRFCTDSGSIFNPPRTPSEREVARSQCWQSPYYQPFRPSTTTPKSQTLHNRDTKRATKTPTTNML